MESLKQHEFWSKDFVEHEYVLKQICMVQIWRVCTHSIVVWDFLYSIGSWLNPCAPRSVITWTAGTRQVCRRSACEINLQDETRRAEASADSFSTEGRKCVMDTMWHIDPIVWLILVAWFAPTFQQGVLYSSSQNQERQCSLWARNKNVLARFLPLFWVRL